MPYQDKKNSLSYYSLIAEEENTSSGAFSKDTRAKKNANSLVPVWNRITDSISCGDNCYAKHALYKRLNVGSISWRNQNNFYPAPLEVTSGTTWYGTPH